MQVEGAAQDVEHLHAAPGWTSLLHVSSGSALKSGLGVMNLQVKHEKLSETICKPLMLIVPTPFQRRCHCEYKALVRAHPHGLPVAVSVTFAPPKLNVTPGGGVMPKALALTKKGVPVKSTTPVVT